MPDVTDKPFKERFHWKRIHAPKPWRPRPEGDEIAGYYGGRTLRSGKFGQYEVVIVHVPFEGSFTISGTGLIALIDAARVPQGHPIRVCFLGAVPVANTDKWFKKFTLDVATGVGLAREDLPELDLTEQPA